MNRYLVKTLAEVLPIFVIASLHKVMYWMKKRRYPLLSIEKWWLILKISLCTFPKQLESGFFSVEKRYALFRERKVVWLGRK